jgi:copper chaperone NosL
MDRRAFLRGSVATVSVGSLAGCLGSDDGENAPDPVDLSGTKFDYQGGMEIGAHGGPNGQVFYQSEQPQPVAGDAPGSDENENLAWFHTLVFGLFPYHFDRQAQGWEPAVVYVTDYSVVDWDLNEDAETPVMPAPTGADTFADATELTYVGESDVMGGMGPALHPFSDEDEATTFAENHDGTTYTFDDINQALIESLQEGGGMSME